MRTDDDAPTRIQIEVATDAESGESPRLDKFLASELPELSRSYVQRLIDEAAVLVDGMPAKRSLRVTPGQQVEVEIPAPRSSDILAEDIPIDRLYEDGDVLVVEKPAGMVVHPAPGHETGTLVNALVNYLPDVSISGSRRPGIVHRLDKDTSGVLVVAKSDSGQASLVEQWKERAVDKRYLGLVHGVVEPEEGTIDAPIGRDPANRLRMTVREIGKPSVTKFRVLRRFDNATLVEAQPVTGRTHQIRVHFRFIGHPIVGDWVYQGALGAILADELGVDRQFLHAERLAFKNLAGSQIQVWSRLPVDLRHCLDQLIAGE